MKAAYVAFLSSLGGAVVGFYLCTSLANSSRAPHAKLEAREIVLVGEDGKPAARLHSSEGRTLLSFYSDHQSLALEMGADRRKEDRYLRFFGTGGNVPVALNSIPPLGSGTLYLGDVRAEARIVIGGLQTDVPIDPSVGTDWGISVREPGFTRPLFQVIAPPGTSGLPESVSVTAKRADGSEWRIQ